jgi:hypothetical protein
VSNQAWNVVKIALILKAIHIEKEEGLLKQLESFFGIE